MVSPYLVGVVIIGSLIIVGAIVIGFFHFSIKSLEKK